MQINNRQNTRIAEVIKSLGCENGNVRFLPGCLKWFEVADSNDPVMRSVIYDKYTDLTAPNRLETWRYNLENER